MNENTQPIIDPQELQASLERLGIRELEERMEVSPLLAAPDIQVTDRCECGFGCSTIDAPTPTITIGIDDDLGGVNHLGS